MSRKTRKLIWSAPLVAVLAVAGALAIFAATAPTSVFANPAPDGVTNFTVSAEGPTSLKLDWDAPDGGEAPTGYRIDWAPSPGHEWQMLVASQTETTYTHEDLIPTAAELAADSRRDVTRYYRVFALNSHGPGPESDIIQQTTNGVSEPGAVEGLTATASGPTQINLSWNAPEDTGGLTITGYRIVSGDDATAITTELVADSDSDATTYPHKKLTAKTTKYYQVFAINALGASTDQSNTADATTGAARRPDPPTEVVAVPSADAATSAVNLYWLEPANNGGRPITEYIIQVSVDGGSYRSFPVTVLDTDDDNFPTADTLPQNYAHTGEEFAGTENDITFVDNMRVQYRIQAKHEDGTSRASSASRSIRLGDTDIDDGDAGSVTQRFPLDVTVAAASVPSGIDLSWTHNIRTGYRIDVSEDGMEWERLERNTGLTLELGSDDLHRYNHVAGINPDDIRHYRVFANDGGIYGRPANVGVNTAGDAEAPDGVRSLSARAANAGQINLSWSAPSKDGGADIEAYLVQFSVDGSTWVPADAELSAFVTRDPAGDTRPAAATDTDGNGHAWVTMKDANDNVITSYSHKGLAHKSRFYYRVLADNGTMLTEAGDAGAQTATTPTASKPAAPMSLSAHPAADSSLGDADERGVYLTWLAPSDPAGAAIEEYEIVRMITGEDDFEVTVTAAGDDPRSFYNDTEELGEQVRRYRVRAVNGAGDGAWSMWVTYPLADHAPGKPTGVKAEKDSAMPASKIKVSWSAPASGAEVTGYIIERRYTGDMVGDIPSDGYSPADGSNRSFAFSNYKEWWETLNCKGMLAVAGSSETEVAEPAAGSDQAMYCAHFLSTAPSNITDSSKELSDDAKEKIKVLFKDRYVVKSDDMGMTMTMFTGMMYTDMGLKENTEYIYRVRAIHGKTAGPWSDKAMATTDSTDKTLGAPTITSVTVDDEDPGSPDIDVAWDNGANALSHMVLLFSTPDYDLAKPVSTRQDDGMTSFDDVAAGTYVVVVVSYNANFDWQFAFTPVTVTAGN